MSHVRQAGFTLLEMMVALAIFAVIGLGGYQLLQGMLRNGEQVHEHGARLSDVERLFALLTRDLSQAAIPTHPALLTAGEAPFITRSDGEERLRLTRRNWLNPLQEPRSSLQRVAWRWSDGTLTRVNLSSGEAGATFTGIQSLQLRFWSGSGWHTDWRTSHRLPQAVEVILTVLPWGEIRHIALLPDGES